MIKTIKSFLLNGLAHYNLSNRIEYLGLILRLGFPVNKMMRINTLLKVNFIYVISLRYKSDRRRFIKNQLNKQKINFSFVDAAEGCAEGDKSIISDRSVSYLTLGSVGCWISHYKVWSRIAKSGFCSVVLEDDVKVNDNFMYNLNYALSLIPSDADVVYINSGNNYLRNMRYLVNNIAFVPYQIRNGAYAYCVTKQGAIKLLNLISDVQVTRGGVDSAIGALIRNKEINAYHLLNPLCMVDFSFGSSTK
ncbi:MAG: glycosyltransferase family 25 protein [Sphingobacteriaceae bacterium]|nr:MAG: glycosyltransferase family 25 protein [Sphingobacteriaceae bacterium]